MSFGILPEFVLGIAEFVACQQSMCAQQPNSLFSRNRKKNDEN